MNDNSFGLESSELDRVVDIFKRHPRIEEAILYGSRAKWCPKRGSDIDIALKGECLDLKKLNEIILELDDLLLPYNIDIAIYGRINNPDLIQHIKRVGKTIYKRGSAKTTMETL